MAIEKPYATFAYYTDEFKGTELDAASFPYFIRWASNLIDSMTFGRILKLPELPDVVRDAACAAAENYHAHRQQAKRGIKSESNDGYSVSYADTNTEAGANAEAESVVRMYLSRTGLLYRGCFEEAPDG